MSNTDDYAKKFQLTDSLLRRLLNSEEYERIKIVEPAIAVTDEGSSKQLKNPGYKHAVVSNKCLYVINTPARYDTDVVFTIELVKVQNVTLIHDVANFLQGDLQKHSQHIKLSCLSYPKRVTEELLAQAKHLSLISLRSDHDSEGQTMQQEAYEKPLQEYLPNQGSVSSNVNENHVPCIRKNPASSSANGLSSLKLHSSSINSHVLPSKRSSRRPLPRPLSGTETLNASYTSSMFLYGMKDSDHKSTKLDAPLRCLSPSKSFDDIANKAMDGDSFHSTSPNSSFSSSKSLSKTSHLHRSWNDILKAEQSNSSSEKERSNSNSSRESLARQDSSNLNQSLSSKFFKLFKGSQENVLEEPSESLESSRKLTSLQVEASIEHTNEYTFDLFTVSKTSNLFNVLRETWITALIDSTTSNDNKTSSLQRNGSYREYSYKNDMDVVIQKFSQLKEEILTCEQPEELFLLTKELIFACNKYMAIKKIVWKSGNLLKVYLSKLRKLVTSTTRKIADQMDEIEVAIIIVEFFICIFQGTELVYNRNLFLNEQSASFVKELLCCVFERPSIGNIQGNDEAEELLSSWYNVSSLLLYEIINAASLSSWNCFVEQKCFNVPLLVQLFQINEGGKLLEHIDHVFTKLAMLFSRRDIDTICSTKEACDLYKYLHILQFICKNCHVVAQNMKVLYQEEIKYYISKDENITRIPRTYPLFHLLEKFLPEVIHLLTQHKY